MSDVQCEFMFIAFSYQTSNALNILIVQKKL